MASIFLSHSSHDNEAAFDLARRLKEHGYDSLFLDFDPDSGIKGGRDWERELYRNLKLARAVIVLCSPSSMASRWCFVEIAQAKALGKAIFPVTIRPCQVESILNDRQVIDLSAVGADEAYRRLFDGLRVAGLDPADNFHWDPRRPPFPGLTCFDAQDAGIYFGREDEVRLVIETLTRLQRQGEPRLLVLVGSSGSGKSSLVRAGVLPRLGKDRPRWALVDPFRPRADPITELAKSLFSAFPEDAARPDWKAIRDRLRAESRAAGPGEGPLLTSALTEYADDLTMHLGRREASVLVVVDQTEELLQGVAGDEASAFLNVLRRATERPGGRVFGLLTLRSDFLGSFQNHPALRGVTFEDLPLGLLPVEHFPHVIEGPADRAGLALEPGLVGSMVAEARTEDALPLLAFTLREMYERCRAEEGLTRRAYRDLGGIKGAVGRVVERIKTEKRWTPEVGRALRRAFLKLVRVNDEGQFTRQPCRWADLPDQAAPVLEAFVQARLLSSNGDVVEVTHESLFRVWPELAAWLDEGRELILWKKNVQDEVKAWLAHDRSPLYLLSGARVAEGRRWLASNADDFSDLENEFITASITAEDARIARERAQQQRLRWLARSLAVGVLAATVLALIAIATGGYAVMKQKEVSAANVGLKAARDDADRQRKEVSKINVGLNDALRQARKNAYIAHINLAQREWDNTYVTHARELLENPDEAEFHGFEWYYLKRIYYPERLTLKGHTSGVNGVAFSPDGTRLASASWDRTIKLWDAATGQEVRTLKGHTAGVNGVAFSPDGTRLASASDDHTVKLWNAATGQEVRTLKGHTSYVEGVSFSPDGTRLASASWDRTIKLWDAATGQEVRTLKGHTAWVHGVSFSPDGTRLASASVDGTLKLWNVASGQEVLTLKGHTLSVNGVAFSPDGKRLASASGDATIKLWDAATGQEVLTLKGHTSYVEGVSFSPDGTRLASASSDHTIKLWDAPPRPPDTLGFGALPTSPGRR